MSCDRCGEVFSNYDDYTCFSDDDIMSEAEEWEEVNGRHYCPNCYTYNEETDEVSVKKPYPFDLKRVKANLNVLFRYNPEFYLTEDDEYYIIKNSRSLPEMPESIRLYIKENLGDDTIIESTESNVKVPGLVGGQSLDGFKHVIKIRKDG